MTVTLATSSTRVSAALHAAGKISGAGAVRPAGPGDDSGPSPFLTRVGAFDVDLALEGIVLLTRQTDQPGIIAAVSAVLGEAGVNISFMTVSRTSRGRDAVMALGVDSQPDADLLAKITGLLGDHGISIASVIQHAETASADAGVPLVIMTHACASSAVQKAVAAIDKSDVIRGKSVCLGVLDE